MSFATDTRANVRLTVLALLSSGLAACASTAPVEPVAYTAPAGIGDTAPGRYTALTNEPFPVPAVSLEMLQPQHRRQLVDYPTDQPPGTIVVDPAHHYLYLVQEGGKALRYGVGVGREGLEWSGTANIAYKREWPRWTPTPDMIAREPGRYRKWAKGMDGGEQNPLGARALYLFEGGKDSLYRIHGTNEPWSIGKSMSSGCIRMMNQDIIDLYRRVPAGTKVVVLSAEGDGTPR
ncbi:MAG: L,D-transpeptidase [Pseudochelatococcus sp.]|jgi:lipoprotein-anchoring transpeptidase ErfK/SrfK|uniref:L,D-transpeptidase n=1 Tax=Pseudochelatococcus sp. TaxID=2020869 RepID=UPI003D907F82